MTRWEDRLVTPRPGHSFGPEDDARLRPLAFARSARMQGRQVCFVCDSPIGTENEDGSYTVITPPVIGDPETRLMWRVAACARHADLAIWPAADYELASWMLRNGWGETMDPAMYGEVQ